MKRLRKVTGDHGFDLSDTFSDGPLRIVQAAYFRGGKVVVAIAELNKPNHWDDDAFDEACAFLQRCWNDAVKSA